MRSPPVGHASVIGGAGGRRRACHDVRAAQAQIRRADVRGAARPRAHVRIVRLRHITID
jgi:hypothetical protein